MKKKEQETKARATEMKHALFSSSVHNCSNPKRYKKLSETDSSNNESETEISLKESSTSRIEMSEESDVENQPVDPKNVLEGSFVLVKFEKKKSVFQYMLVK